MKRMTQLLVLAALVPVLASCTSYKRVPEAQNKAICQSIPAQGSPARCVITRDTATLLPQERLGKWTMVMAQLSSPPGTKITRVVFRRDLCTPQGCNHAVPCIYGCGPRAYPNDGMDYSKAGEGIVQWWGRVDSEDPEGWLFDVHYQ
jgi:hypothetical protein